MSDMTLYNQQELSRWSAADRGLSRQLKAASRKATVDEFEAQLRDDYAENRVIGLRNMDRLATTAAARSSDLGAGLIREAQVAHGINVINDIARRR